MEYVSACGKTFSIEDYEGNPVTFGGVLARAKTEQGHALCRCATPAPLLVIRRKAGPDGDRYFLATWPNKGTDHNPKCRFYVSDGEYDKAYIKRLAAVQETEDGFSIRAGFSMRRMVREGTDPTARLGDGRDGVGRSQRDTMGLLGTLHYLWETAGLNRYSPPSKRRWGEVVTRLCSATAQGKLGHVPIQEIMYVVPPFEVDRKMQTDRNWNTFARRFERTTETVPMFLLLGEIKSTSVGGQSIVTHLRHHAAPVYMSNQLATTIAKRYPSEEARLGDLDATSRVIGLFQVELTDRGNMWVNDAALMLASREYLPCDSSHEARLADKLVEEEHSFEKPFVVDSRLGMLPDFILLGTRSPTYMEVWGMGTAEYMDRKAGKIALYRSKGLPLWQWDAVTTREIPALPGRAKS